MIKKIILGILALIVFIGAIGFIYFLNQISIPASGKAEEKVFVIEKGQGVKEISANLKKEGLIKNDYIFQIYLWLKKYGYRLQAGEYRLPLNLNIVELSSQVVNGEALSKERVVKIIEGWSSVEIAEYLADFYAEDNGNTGKSEEALKEEFKSDFLKAVETTDSRELIPNKTYSFLADKPADQGLEGYLFPDTYRVYRNAEISSIIEKMLDNFDQKLTSEMRTEIERQGKTVFEIITMASIVEKEVRGTEDRKIAAGIFYKRMEQGIPLESDATVNYITGKQALQPTLEDTRKESPYNTYLNKGLPPGPICNPGLNAIEAAIYPEKSDYLYFLTKPDGSTVFSKTYEEHLANKRKYLSN